MSTHTLNKKIQASGTNFSHSHKSNEGFSLHSGPRNLSYIGKSSKNSTVQTTYIGIYPKNYVHNSNNNIDIPRLCDEKVHIHGNQPNNHSSVLGTKSMIRNRFKWIHSGSYPNNVVQPSLDQGYDTYIKKVKTCQIRKNAFSKPVTTPCNNCKKAFGSMQLNHIPTVSLKEQNDQVVKDTQRGPLDYDTRYELLVYKCTNPDCKTLPFPYPTTNPGSSLPAGCGGGTEIERYLSPPLWYTDCSKNPVDPSNSSVSNMDVRIGYDYAVTPNYSLFTPQPPASDLKDRQLRIYFKDGPNKIYIAGRRIPGLGSNPSPSDTFQSGLLTKYFSTKNLALVFELDNTLFPPYTLITTTLNGIKHFIKIRKQYWLGAEQDFGTIDICELLPSHTKFITDGSTSPRSITLQLGNVTTTKPSTYPAWEGNPVQFWNYVNSPSFIFYAEFAE